MRPKTEGSVHKKKCTHFLKEVGSRKASAEVWEGRWVRHGETQSSEEKEDQRRMH